MQPKPITGNPVEEIKTALNKSWLAFKSNMAAFVFNSLNAQWLEMQAMLSKHKPLHIWCYYCR